MPIQRSTYLNFSNLQFTPKKESNAKLQIWRENYEVWFLAPNFKLLNSMRIFERFSNFVTVRKNVWIPLRDKWPHFWTPKWVRIANLLSLLDWLLNPAFSDVLPAAAQSYKVSKNGLTKCHRSSIFFWPKKMAFVILGGHQKIIHDNSNFHRFKFQALKMIWLL